jgi:diadenosine tetraphosphate (Ap4A) HIT family hydrolase
MMDCFACTRIEQIKRGRNPHFIAELIESYAVLSDEQPYQGWTILLLKDHHEQLAQLPAQRQSRLWDDVAHVARAITNELKPVRINYENLGNQLHHIHWHVIPRYANDPDPTRPIWLRDPGQMNVKLNAADEANLIARLRRALEIR